MATRFPDEQNPENRPNLPGEKPLDPGQEPGPQPQCPLGWHATIINDGDARRWQCVPGAGNNAPPNQSPDDNQEGGGGGGGPRPGGGGGGGGPAPITPFGPGKQVTDFNNLLQQRITDALNSPSRYSPEVLQELYGQIAAGSSSRIARESAAVRENAAGRGLSRAGQTDAALREVRAGAETARGQSKVNVDIAKVNADYEDKMGALDRAQKFLDSMRDSEYRYTLLGEQRRQFDANLKLGYAALANQVTLLNLQTQSQFDLFNLQAGYGFLNGGA